MRPRRQVGSLRRPLNFTVRHHMRVVVRVVAGLLAAASLPLTGLADELRLSGLRIHWLDGFTLASKRDALPMKLVGAAGEDVGISVMRRSTPYPREQGASALSDTRTSLSIHWWRSLQKEANSSFPCSERCSPTARFSTAQELVRSGPCRLRASIYNFS